MGIVSWFIVRFILQRSLFARLKGRKQGLLKAKNENGEDIYCKDTKSLFCPFYVGLAEYGLTLKINDSTSRDDRLYDKKYVYDKEEKGKAGSPWKDIWIFSETLDSEIDNKSKSAETVLVENIKNHGTHYTIFHLGIESYKNEIEERKLILSRQLSEKGKKLTDFLKFISIDVENGYLGKNTLPLLCGSILFSQNPKTNEMPHFTEGYLSIRKNNEDDPIYYCMPRCMLEKYSEYFEKIYMSNISPEKEVKKYENGELS